MLFSKVPILGRLFPDVETPWSAVDFRGSGLQATESAGDALSAGYDPNYSGTFVELNVGEPPVFTQLPAALMGEAMSRLRFSPQAERA